MRTQVATLVVVLTGTASAQPATLQALLAGADEHNVDRRVSLEQAVKAASDVQSAWGALLPSLTAQGAWTHNQYEVKLQTGPTTTLTIQPLDQLDATLRVDLPLVDTSRWLRLQAARIGEEAAGQRVAATRDLVRRQIVASWYSYAAAQAVGASAQESRAVADEQAKLMEIREKAGAVTELELLRARAEVQRTRQVVADTTVLVNVTRRALETLTGLAPHETAQLPPDDLSPEPAYDELARRAEQLPQVRAAAHDAEAARALALASRLTLVPSVSAQFTERFTNATSFSGKSASSLAGVNVVWRVDVPTFYAMRSQQAIAATADLGAERARLQARDQVYSDGQKLDSARTKVEAARAQVQAAQRAAKVASDRFAVGAATQVDVIQAERDFFSAEVALISARTELASARAFLRLSAGLPVDAE